jgi:chromosome segregation ATPase
MATTKKPAVTTQLKLANAEIARLKEELAKMESAKKAAESTKDHYYKKYDELSDELEQLHSLLDAFEGALPRTSRKEGSYSDTNYSVTVRLCSWLAKR